MACPCSSREDGYIQRGLSMKESRYNHYFRRNGKDYAFNAMTCALAEVDESFFEAIRQVREGSPVADNKLFENMRYGGYIIPDLFDERSALKLRSQANKFSSRGLGLTIAPTLACNFACPYCYENSVPGVMSQEVQDAVVALVERRATRGDEIQVTWYGGEPLIALTVVEALSARMVEVCDTANVAYSAYMVSNGYLVTPNVIEVLKRCRVSAMQITIDGPRAIHDSRRKLKADGSGSFDTIVENVKLLLDCGIRCLVPRGCLHQPGDK